ncbi:hypothetical protein, partial [Moritella sp.]|uniref:hypothetical protein n=1 Tax=Moritella sp. TaxID=78556 RepID=UPI0025EB8C9B
PKLLQDAQSANRMKRIFKARSRGFSYSKSRLHNAEDAFTRLALGEASWNNSTALQYLKME